ncbi:MAG TPA: GNAT family N-acetyltransferase [Candidatus Acidoferrum sp.]|nr:GNAT family N-acetyltransferase [Candidatus Acidoferrum sp.]
MNAVKYRRAVKSDVLAMARIRALSWGTEGYWQTRIAAYMDGELHPQLALMPRVNFVAIEGDSVVGLIAGHLTTRHACDGELEWIDVIAEKRGSGVASELLRHLARWFVEKKAPRICVDVDPGNTVARRFYVRNGAEELKPHWLVWNDIGTILGKQ